MADKRLILVIEDDSAIRQGIVDMLDFQGYRVREAGDGRKGMDLALRSPCDLILLDLILPGNDGLKILEELRKSRPTLPVIIMTARGAENDRVKGLKMGADDYVVKPFSVRELMARVEAVLRRSPDRPLDIKVIDLPDGSADLERREVIFSDKTRRELSERDVELLRYLALNSDRAVSRDEIMERIWRLNPRAIIETRTIDMHIARLREKLRDDTQQPKVIRTVRGKGYMLEKG